mgnify:CR=1 FL=1
MDILQERFGRESRFTLVHADALAWLRETPRDWSTTKLVANLPYSVGSPILVELALTAQPPSRMVVTLQWGYGPNPPPDGPSQWHAVWIPQCLKIKPYVIDHAISLE